MTTYVNTGYEVRKRDLHEKEEKTDFDTYFKVLHAHDLYFNPDQKKI